MFIDVAIIVRFPGMKKLKVAAVKLPTKTSNTEFVLRAKTSNLITSHTKITGTNIPKKLNKPKACVIVGAI